MSSLSEKRRKGFRGWYDRLSQFNIENLFVRAPPVGPPRTIFVNEPLPADYYDPKKPHKVKKEYRYPANQVITSKYTLLTFIPRNLLEQFRRIANIFFLVIAILQFFNKFSTISPGLVVLPLIIVWGFTMLKDGYEDFKRHQSDRRVNYSPVRVLSGGGWINPNAMAAKSRTFVRALTQIRKPRLTRKTKVGRRGANPDVQMLEHAAPPEAIAGQTTDEPVVDPVPFVEYDNDNDADSTGEHGMAMFHHHGPSRPHWSRGIWEDLKVGDILKIVDGESIPADVLICATSQDENVAFVETKNLDGETNLKSRTAVPPLTHMRTAAACASPKNAFRIEADRPELLMHKLNAAVVIDDERFAVDMNQVLLRGTVLKNTDWVIGIVMYTGNDTKLVLNAGRTPSKRGRVERQMDPMVFANLIILAIMAVVCAIVDSVLEQRFYPRAAPWLFNDNRSDDNPHINGLVTWAFALITFQNIVPISLYISIEVVRTAQAAFIYFDREMFYEKTGTATVARSFVLSDDLGQVEYIFSDKTGTLTQNAMVFRRASIGGQVFVGNEDIEDVMDPSKSVKSLKDDMMPSSASTSASPSPRQPQEEHVLRPMDASHVKLSGGVLQHFRCEPLTAEINAAASNPDSADRHRIGMFWTTLALCHTVLAGVDPETGDLEYKAQSPDEAALVQAAADIGFEFRGRDRDVLYVRTPFATEQLRFRLLTILDFTSARKRMSVLVRPLDANNNEVGSVLLLSKGADSVIFERLAPGSEELKATTEAQLDEFASSGLRTLTLGFREVPQGEYDAWLEEYKAATSSVEDRETKVERVSGAMEHGLTLLGATAIEDRLQDGVPETIADLKRAGIKIWVLTGDKLETAIAIGHSTNLISADSNVIIIRGKAGETDGRSIYRQMLRAAEEYFPGSGILDDPLVVVEDLGMIEATHQPRNSQSFPMRRMSADARSLVGDQNGQRPGGYVLVIDGLALEDALGDPKHKHLLLKLGTMCQGVVCCRVSPKQKALVVRLVKDGLNTMTLAIGDGANDVSMIQAADVGVGISGEEGLQAVNSSDYAIAQFRYLKRLLLVHGHWSYARNGNMITNFFYKNIICIGVLWWFQIYCGWSSAYVFEYTYLLWWNSFWTVAPVIGIGVFDRILDDHVLMAIPELYRYGREQKWFGNKLFAIYMFDGIVQSAIVFFPILYTYNATSGRSDGYQVAQYEFATVMAISAVLCANLFNGLNTNVWTAWVFFAVFLGIVLIWAYTAIYSIISPGWIVTPVFGNDWFLFRSPLFWFSLPITVLISLLPRYIYKAIKYGFFPDDVDILRWNYKMNPQLDFEHDVRLPTHSHMRFTADGMLLPMPTSPYRTQTTQTRPSMMGSQIDMATGVRSQSRGYGFAAEEQGVEMRRIQSHLSSTTHLPRRASRGSRVLQTIRKPLRRKRPTEITEEH